MPVYRQKMTNNIYLLRHGETTSGPCFRGSTDDELTDIGRQQMAQGVAGYEKPQLVISSPLRRCAEFANHYASRYQLPVEICPDIQEINFGAWEGATAEQILAVPGNRLEAFWADPYSVTPPGGEAFSDFKNRVVGAWQRIRSRAERPIWVICHGGPIRLITLMERQMHERFLMQIDVPNGSMHGFSA
jgi:alpha-ribazole phosphatase